MHPLSRGLLVSMAIRCCHDYGLDREPNQPAFMGGFDDAEREELLTRMHALYQRFAGGYRPAPYCGGDTGSDSQLWEECSGQPGFYNPDSEARYAKSWPKGFNPDWLPQGSAGEMEKAA